MKKPRPEDEPLDRPTFIARFAHKVSARTHMTLICLATIAVGVLISKAILFFNFASPMIRYGISVSASYAVFFICVYIWMHLHFDLAARSQPLAPERSDSLDVDDGLDLIDMATDSSLANSRVFSGGRALEQPMSRENFANDLSVSSLSDGADFDEGVVIILILAVFASILGAAGYLVYQAPEILLEAAFEAALGAGLLKQTRKMQSEGWHVSIFKRTWWLFALVLVASMIFGAYIQNACPEADSFAQYREVCGGKAPNDQQ